MNRQTTCMQGGDLVLWAGTNEHQLHTPELSSVRRTDLGAWLKLMAAMTKVCWAGRYVLLPKFGTQIYPLGRHGFLIKLASVARFAGWVDLHSCPNLEPRTTYQVDVDSQLNFSSSDFAHHPSRCTFCWHGSLGALGSTAVAC